MLDFGDKQKLVELSISQAMRKGEPESVPDVVKAISAAISNLPEKTSIRMDSEQLATLSTMFNVGLGVVSALSEKDRRRCLKLDHEKSVNSLVDIIIRDLTKDDHEG